MSRHLVDSNQPGSSAVASGVRESSSMRKVNRGMRAVSGSFALSDPIAFFCECQIPTCNSAVWISSADFDAIMSRPSGWLLVEGHEPSTPWPTVDVADLSLPGADRLLVDGWVDEHLPGGEAA